MLFASARNAATGEELLAHFAVQVDGIGGTAGRKSPVAAATNRKGNVAAAMFRDARTVTAFAPTPTAPTVSAAASLCSAPGRRFQPKTARWTLDGRTTLDLPTCVAVTSSAAPCVAALAGQTEVAMWRAWSPAALTSPSSIYTLPAAAMTVCAVPDGSDVVAALVPSRGEVHFLDCSSGGHVRVLVAAALRSCCALLDIAVHPAACEAVLALSRPADDSALLTVMRVDTSSDAAWGMLAATSVEPSADDAASPRCEASYDGFLLSAANASVASGSFAEGGGSDATPAVPAPRIAHAQLLPPSAGFGTPAVVASLTTVWFLSGATARSMFVLPGEAITGVHAAWSERSGELNVLAITDRCCVRHFVVGAALHDTPSVLLKWSWALGRYWVLGGCFGESGPRVTVVGGNAAHTSVVAEIVAVDGTGTEPVSRPLCRAASTGALSNMAVYETMLLAAHARPDSEDGAAVGTPTHTLVSITDAAACTRVTSVRTDLGGALVTALRITSIEAGVVTLAVGDAGGNVHVLEVPLTNSDGTTVPAFWSYCHPTAVAAVLELSTLGCPTGLGRAFLSASEHGHVAYHPMPDALDAPTDVEDDEAAAWAATPPAARGVRVMHPYAGPAPTTAPDDTALTPAVAFPTEWSAVVDMRKGWLHLATPRGGLVWHIPTASLVHRVDGRGAFDPHARCTIGLRRGRGAALLSVNHERLPVTKERATPQNVADEAQQTLLVDVSTLLRRAEKRPPFPPDVRTALGLLLDHHLGDLRKATQATPPGGAVRVVATEPAQTPRQLSLHLIAVAALLKALGVNPDPAVASQARDDLHPWLISATARAIANGAAPCHATALDFVFHTAPEMRAAARDVLAAVVSSSASDTVQKLVEHHASVLLSDGSAADSAAVERSLASLALFLVALNAPGTPPVDFTPDGALVERVADKLVKRACAYRCAAASPSDSVMLEILESGWITFRSLVVQGDREALWTHLLEDAASEGEEAVMDDRSRAGGVVRSLAALCAFHVAPFTVAATTAASQASSGGVHVPLPFSKSSHTGTRSGTKVDANVIRLATLRTLTLLCSRYTARAQRNLHAILRFAWACIDPHSPAPATRRMCTPAVAFLFRAAVDRVPTFDFNQASQRVAVSSGDEPRVTVYDVKSTSKLVVFDCASGVAALAFGAEGATVATLEPSAKRVLTWRIEATKSLFGLVSGGATASPCGSIEMPNPGPEVPGRGYALVFVSPRCVQATSPWHDGVQVMVC